MKTRLALLVVVLAVIVLALFFILVKRPAPEPDIAIPSPAPTTAPTLASTPQAVVVAYLEALEREDFAAAYELLSGPSRQAHPYEEFVSQCEQGGATNYDLSAALEVVMTEADVRASVTVPLIEDPAEATFAVVLEEGGWKVVFIGGAPWFPYP